MQILVETKNALLLLEFFPQNILQTLKGLQSAWTISLYFFYAPAIRRMVEGH